MKQKDNALIVKEVDNETFNNARDCKSDSSVIIKNDSDSRRIYFTGSFDESKAEKIVTNLLDLESKNPMKDILIYIDSYGGYVDSFFSIHDTIKMLRCKVSTIGIGKAMSCGFLLLISGTKGYRFMTPNARILIHKISGYTFGNVTDMDDDVEEAKRQQTEINKLIVNYTNLTKQRLEKIMERQSYFSAKDAKEMGIIDEIVESNSQIYKKISI